MIKEAICTGETVEEAKERAIEELGASLDEDIQFEVLATPKKKTLGIFGGSLAKVRVYVELPDPIVKEKPAKAAKAKAEKVKNTPKAEKKEKPVKVAEEAPKAVVEDDGPELPAPVPAAEVAADSPAGRAVAYLSVMLKGLGVEECSITVQALDNMAVLNLEGEGLGVVIGHRGETLNALQYLTSLSANSGNGYFRITLNIGNYREKRHATLRNLAKRMSAQALRTGRSRSLEPMNPYERRIIHTTVQSIEGVVSFSAGEGDNRHVIIRPENAPERSDYRDRRTSRDRRGSRPAAPVVDPNREVKKDNTDIPLYSKIN